MFFLLFGRETIEYVDLSAHTAQKNRRSCQESQQSEEKIEIWMNLRDSHRQKQAGDLELNYNADIDDIGNDNTKIFILNTV